MPGRNTRRGGLRARELKSLFCVAVLRRVSFVLLILVVLASHNLWLVAASAQAITRGYASDDPELRPGMTVALTGDKSGDLPKVAAATVSDQDRIIGVATTLSDSLVTVGSSVSQVYIENEGNVSAYVTDVNGAIKRGDLLSISPIKGLLMRSAGSANKVVAIAQEDFSQTRATSYKITGSSKSEVMVEQIQVNLDTKGGNSGQGQSSALSRIGQSLTGKQISDLRMMIALVVFFIVMVSEGTILYGAISSALRSLGRNPMASTVIKKEMLRVVLIAVVVLLVGLAAIYAMLWA